MQAQAGLSDAGAGALASVNYLGYMTGALMAAWLDDVRWRHRGYLAGLWLALLSTAAMATTDHIAVWALCRFLGGLCGASGMLLGSGLVLGWLMRHGHRPELGVHFIGIGLGIVVTAAGAWSMGGWLTQWQSQWLGFAVLGLLFCGPAWAFRPPVPDAPAPVAAAQVAPAFDRSLIWLMLSYFAAGWGFVISATFTVAMVEREPALAGQGALAWAMVGLAAMPAVFVWDRVARRWGHRQALMLAFGLQILSVVLPAMSPNLAGELAGALIYGATFIGLVSLMLALVGRRAPTNPGKAMARMTLAYGAAQIVAPVVAGQMAQASGRFDSALWLTAGVLLVGLLLLTRVPDEPPR
jgi:MFS family permease